MMKAKPSFTRTIVSVVVGLTLTLSTIDAAYANSGLKSEMGKMFGSMSNSTKPGVFETSRRGVLSGGSLVVRNKIMNTSIVAFQPPVFDAGCGGIDFYGGSFSFINKDQFVQLARSIASNAAGFAFMLALGAMSEAIKGIIQYIQEKVQMLNEYFGNSCQMAQGLVEGGQRAYQKMTETDGSLAKAIEGGVGDIFETFTSHGGSEPLKNLPSTKKEVIEGNIVWQALKKAGVSNWYANGGNQLNLAIMSVTGTVIVGPVEPNADGKEATKITTISSNKLTLKQLVKGGSVDVLVCDEMTHCLKPSIATGSSATITGFEDMTLNILVGDGATPGALQNMRAGIPLSASQKYFIANLPDSAGAMIFRLSRISEEMAAGFINEIAEPLARDMAFDMLISFIDGGIAAVNSHQEPANAKQAIDQLNLAKSNIFKEHNAMTAEGMKFSEITTKYNALLQAASGASVTPAN